jgi:hypothetical protein
MHSYGAVLAYYAVLVLLALQSSWTQPGTTATGPMSTVLNVNTTSQATTGTVEEVLATYTLPANTLSANGKGVRITAWGTTAANGNAKTTRIRFGGIGGTIVATVAGSSSGSAVVLSCVIARTGAATQTSVSLTQLMASSTNSVTVAAPTQTLSGTVDIVVTGTTATSAGDLTFVGMIVEALN